jgi:L-glyceraldehyde 3-phosphate reductase
VLTDRYLDGIPDDSRAAKPHGFLDRGEITDHVVGQVRRLRDVARKRGQSVAQLALAWVLRQSAVTSVLIGASRVGQIDECVGALENLAFTRDELTEIDRILNG